MPPPVGGIVLSMAGILAKSAKNHPESCDLIEPFISLVILIPGNAQQSRC